MINRAKCSWLFLSLAGVAALLSGCVKQSIVVRSDPAGAMVYFDGDKKGTTPVEFPFKWYGGHRVRIEQEGFQPVAENVEIKSPAHLKIPIDFFVEVIPYNFKDRHELNYKLEPTE
jgi:hypothetical protein